MVPARLSRFDGGTVDFVDLQGNVIAAADLPSPCFEPVDHTGRAAVRGSIQALVTRRGRIAGVILRDGDGRPGLVEAVGPAGSSAAIHLDRVDARPGEVVSLPRLACLAAPSPTEG